MRGPAPWSRTNPRLGELSLVFTCAITSKPVAGGRLLSVRPQFVVFACAFAWRPKFELAPVSAVPAIQSLNSALDPKTHKLADTS